jgi:predicted ArsR family transcriptional regulator
MTTLQIQARALGDPTRHQIFRYIVDADGPAGVAELTEHLNLNHNAIRQHLAKLVEAGLVLESTGPALGRGRPRLNYVTNPANDARWGGTGPYERLAVLLTEMVRSGDSPLEAGRKAGRSRVNPGVPGSQVDALAEQMARLGFNPAVRERSGGAEVTLQTCPFAAAVVADPDTVCELHLGLAHGMAEVLGGLVVDGLVRKDPYRAMCRLHCHLTSDAPPGPPH